MTTLTKKKLLALPAAAGLIGAVLVAPTGLASAASVSPVLTAGNPSCAQLGYDYGLKPGAGASEDTPGTFTDGGLSVTWSFTNGQNDGYVDWSATIAPDAVVVKGGNAANVYAYGGAATTDTSLVTPNNASGKPAGVSHLEFCYNYKPLVAKTANTSFTRTYDWSVTKSADPATLLLSEGQAATVDYTVSATRGEGVDSDWAVSGDIVVTNPWNKAATISVSDALPNAVVTCPTTTLPALGTVTCTYAAPVATGAAGTNTATVTALYTSAPRTVTASAPYSFGSPTTTVDATATLSDQLTCPAGFECTVTGAPNGAVLTASGTVKYSVSVKGTQCGQTGTIANTATLTETDSGQVRDASANVSVESAACGAGCTLTQGYWKTHSAAGPAPYDDAWKNIGPAEQNTPFYSSGQTWLQVFNTAPKGNAYYILGVQYMAAKLNVLNGASTTPEVTQAIASAEALFAHTNGTTLSKSNADAAKKLADLLDGYNNGLTGPGHCSE